MEDVMLDSFQYKATMFDFSLHLLIGETFYIFWIILDILLLLLFYGYLLLIPF